MPAATAGDDWMSRPFIAKDMQAAGLHFDRLRSDDDPVGYTPINPALQRFADSEMVDVVKTLASSEPHQLVAADGRLSLCDQS